ncbi:MAG: MATE family efflux transporter [Acidobacteria bacterium]|nr:MATE family efflux transporter [Acidobacteriota bacterium]
MLRLAGPVVLSELGWIAMGIVDTAMVGRVSAAAIGGVSIGSVLFITVALFGSGIMLGLDTLVSHAFGAGRVEDCHRSLVSAIWLILPLTPLLMSVLWLGIPLLGSCGIHPAVVHEAVPYMKAITWSMFPLLLYFAFRRYLQGMSLVRPVMFALITANLVNAAANWILVFGHFGAPAMGAEGSGWATCFSRGYMAAVLLVSILYHDHRHKTGLLRTPLKPDLVRLRGLIGLGLPAAAQITVEVGVFATATALIGRLNPVASAAHQIAMNCVTATFMVPLGVSAAGAVRVGQALGRGHPKAAERSGWTALLLGAGFMLCAAVAFLVAPEFIAGLLTSDLKVRKAGGTLLAVAAFFQLFDGLQVVATGILRGAGDTRTPMLWHLVGYWLVGLPVGSFLCFTLGWGARGLWIGLCLALILIGVALLLAWSRTTRTLASAP